MNIEKDSFAGAPRFENDGKSHLFLGDPFSDALDKTTVEEGNVFSPGMWTFGVYHCVYCGTEQFAYTTAGENDRRWYFDEAKILCAQSDFGSFTLRSSLFHLGGRGTFGVDFFRAEAAGRDLNATMSLVIGFAEEGPAGGPIHSVAAEGSGLLINGVKIIFETPPDRLILREKGAYAYFSFGKGKDAPVSMRAVHGFPDRAFGWLERLNDYHTMSFDQAKEIYAVKWKNFRTELICPDPRLQRAYEDSLFHILNAMETGLPRISQWNYPLFWIRDCVIVLRALEYAGFSDLAGIGCDYLSGLIFGGGFGCESDNPGEGVWALAFHYAMTKDKTWLKGIYPDIRKRIEWIRKMASTDSPLFMSGDSRTVWGLSQPGVNLVCLANQDGLVHGRMDWHSPDFYINCWCCSGLWEGAKLAEEAGDCESAREWRKLASDLRQKIAGKLLPSAGKSDESNERDSCITPYPSGVIGADNNEFTEWFGKWFSENRLDEKGCRKPEPYWTYFEAAQIHNAFLLGFTDMAWKALDGFLSDSRFGENHIFFEGVFDGTENLPYDNAPDKKGWLKKGAVGGNMPHNWTSAEVFTMLRDLFVTEDLKNHRLALANCVPGEWRKPGSRIGVKHMPTVYGEISYMITFQDEGRYTVEFDGEADYIVNCAANL